MSVPVSFHFNIIFEQQFRKQLHILNKSRMSQALIKLLHEAMPLCLKFNPYLLAAQVQKWQINQTEHEIGWKRKD